MKKSEIDFFEKLKEKRKKIDLIDRRLLSLLNQRLRTALEVGKIKRKMGTKIYDPRREEKVLEKLKSKNRGPLKDKDLKKIFGTIIRICRSFQVKML